MAHQEYTKHFLDISVHITNEKVVHRTGQQRLETIRRQLPFLGHIFRKSHIEKNTIEGKMKDSKLEADKE